MKLWTQLSKSTWFWGAWITAVVAVSAPMLVILYRLAFS